MTLKRRVEQKLREAGLHEQTQAQAGYRLAEEGRRVIVRWRQSLDLERQTAAMRFLPNGDLERLLKTLEAAGFGVDPVDDARIGWCLVVFDKP